MTHTHLNALSTQQQDMLKSNSWIHLRLKYQRDIYNIPREEQTTTKTKARFRLKHINQIYTQNLYKLMNSR